MGTACAIVNEFLCLDFLTLNSTRWIFNSLRMAIKREREEVHIAKQYLCRGLYSTPRRHWKTESGSDNFRSIRFRSRLLLEELINC